MVNPLEPKNVAEVYAVLLTYMTPKFDRDGERIMEIIEKYALSKATKGS